MVTMVPRSTLIVDFLAIIKAKVGRGVGFQ